MRALISVSDKGGLVPFVQALVDYGYEVISTGGTARVLAENGISVVPIDDVTGFPEMLDGRVKTLHPKIHGGLLARRDLPAHMAACEEHAIGMIDLVVVNLYPFEQTISKPDVSVAQAIENIDIGGPSMLRSAAKNYQSVGVVVNPAHYDRVLADLKANKGVLSVLLKTELAAEAFAHTAYYDALIADYFQKSVLDSESAFQPTITKPLVKQAGLRYGENPHQAAAVYSDSSLRGTYQFEQHHGKELSYNNYIDLDAAYQLVREFDWPAAAVIKHTNPCGVAVAETVQEAYQKAHDADPVSAFGSIVGLNRRVNLDTATRISKTFVEAVIAPGFDPDALEHLKQKANIRLITVDFDRAATDQVVLRPVFDRLLVQEQDHDVVDDANIKVVTDKQVDAQLLDDLKFANTVVKHVKSNAIVLAKDGVIVGVGAGQMSRVKSVEIAIEQAGDAGQDAVLASDAFFPFSDSVELAHEAGISAIIQPGGSKRDQDSITCCNEHDIAMVFTGMRHFKH